MMMEAHINPNCNKKLHQFSRPDRLSVVSTPSLYLTLLYFISTFFVALDISLKNLVITLDLKKDLAKL